MTDLSSALARWHAVIETGDVAGVRRLLAPDAVFRSPAVYAPQEGADLVAAYLTAAMSVLGDHFRYEREWVGADSAVLEFVSEVDGRELHGIDMITWDADGLISNFTVMVRPLSGLNALMPRMAQELARGPQPPAHP
ncbi:nuclear transport factor 2 family protein [Nocardioides sp.]|uniref:nuclear transport factor 2 family protein n=1 Tax=Nocardioides sp. TaxID=35761 RepID=UPI003D1348C4